MGHSPNTKNLFVWLPVCDELLSTPKIVALLAKSLPKLREYAPSSTIPIMQAGVFIYLFILYLKLKEKHTIIYLFIIKYLCCYKDPN